MVQAAQVPNRLFMLAVERQDFTARIKPAQFPHDLLLLGVTDRGIELQDVLDTSPEDLEVLHGDFHLR